MDFRNFFNGKMKIEFRACATLLLTRAAEVVYNNGI